MRGPEECRRSHLIPRRRGGGSCESLMQPPRPAMAAFNFKVIHCSISSNAPGFSSVNKDTPCLQRFPMPDWEFPLPRFWQNQRE